VTAELDIQRRASTPAGTPLVLDGDELECVSVEIDGESLPEAAFEATPQKLTLHEPPSKAKFTLRIVTRLDPSSNSTLMGLYLSSGVYCTQCEPEGFRRITYFLDRPDVLSI